MPPRQVALSPHSDNLIGRPVAISPLVPTAFDTPLTEPYKIVGRWALEAAESATGLQEMSRPNARRFIEKTFSDAVEKILEPVNFISLRVSFLSHEAGGPPAILTSTTWLGSIDLQWLENDEIPVEWRAAAYRVLEHSLPPVVPALSFDEFFEELSRWYWDCETDDDGAKEALIAYHGADVEDLDGMLLPSEVLARVPDWMKAENAAPLSKLPKPVARQIRAVERARRAFMKTQGEDSAWYYDGDILCEYGPWFYDASMLPPVTIVPAGIFDGELDDVMRPGMEQGFSDACGIMPVTGPASIDHWFETFAAGAAVLAEIEKLLNLRVDV